MVKSVEWLESGGSGVVDGGCCGLYERLDVRFVLIDECLNGVHVDRSEERFEFGSCLGKCLVN